MFAHFANAAIGTQSTSFFCFSFPLLAELNAAACKQCIRTAQNRFDPMLVGLRPTKAKTMKNVGFAL